LRFWLPQDVLLPQGVSVGCVEFVKRGKPSCAIFMAF
jgi:hypothetical protein